jgi:5-methylcytosine-specific restriction enzyme A
MSSLPSGFNPSIDRYDRRSVTRLFRLLWPDPEISTAFAKTLATSIRVAHKAGDASWEVTMFSNRLRLNVGQVEVLTLSADRARLLVHAPLSSEDASPGNVEIGSKPYYPAVPVPSGVCFMAAHNLSLLSPTVREAHDNYVRAAASFKRRSPFRKSFSPAVLEYLEAALLESIPLPSYLPQEAATTRVEPLPDEVDVSTPIREGAKYQVIVNAYERNPVARSCCIAHYGPTCVVCGLNFGAVYGPLAEGFIHVHHIRPLSEIAEEYEVNPAVDLRPVCPNCHAVIHLGGGCRRIEEVRELFEVPKAPNQPM